MPPPSVTVGRALRYATAPRAASYTISRDTALPLPRFRLARRKSE